MRFLSVVALGLALLAPASLGAVNLSARGPTASATLLIADDAGEKSHASSGHENHGDGSFGHSVSSGAKGVGQSIKHGARQVGHSVVRGWNEFKHNFTGH